MYGLKSQRKGCDDMPLNKPWSLMTNSNELLKALNVRCDRTHNHAIVMGSDTKRTEGYTVEIADRIHRAWNAELSALVTLKGTPANQLSEISASRTSILCSSTR